MKTISPEVQRAASWLPLLLAILVSMSGGARAQTPDSNAHNQLLREYAGSDNWYALLRNPKVWPQLQRLLGKDLRHLQDNLSVSGAVDVVGGDLSVSGNAPHQGTVEEAVVCVNSYNLEVNAAVFSKGIITAYSRTKNYNDLSRCIKSWITLVNSERRDLVSQPKNVHMARGT